MAKFMFLHRGGCDQAPKRSPEQMQQAMQAWGKWMEDGMKAGWLLDAGDGLKSEGKVVLADGTVTDGPFAESKELVGGYCMVEAANLATAVDLAKAMPESGATAFSTRSGARRSISGHSHWPTRSKKRSSRWSRNGCPRTSYPTACCG